MPQCNGVVAIFLQPTGGNVQIIAVQAAILASSATASASSTTALWPTPMSRFPTRTAPTRAAEASGRAIDKQTVDGTQCGDGLTILAGDPIKWKYKVTNTGNMTLHNIVVRDSDSQPTSV